MTEIEIQRPVLAPRAGDGAFHVGVAEVDVTPHPDLPLAGFSMEGTTAHGVRGHLWMRVLYLRDAAGAEVVLAWSDLMSGSRLLLEKIAERTARADQIGVERILLSGTHTHAGPGWFYGNSLYDTFAAEKAGFDAGLVDWIAERAAGAVHRARESAVAGRVGFGTADLYGYSRNRSIEPFRSNPEAAAWNTAGFPGAAIPREFNPQQRAVDPRVSVLVATDASGVKPIGVFGIFGCHATAMGPHSKFYSSDWPGDAVRHARAELEPVAGGKVVVAVGCGATGDVNAWRTGLDPDLSAGPRLSRYVGRGVGKALAEAARAALQQTGTPAVQVWFSEPRHDDPPPAGGGKVRLAAKWCFGAPTMGGSEESRSLLHRTGLTWEGQTDGSFAPDDPQFPKAKGLGLVQDLLGKVLDLDPSPIYPLHCLRLGEFLLATVPGEPTTWAAFEIERALVAASGAREVRVLGYTGDYGGYFTTLSEYKLQHYEGASTLLGRNATAYLQARLGELLQQAPGAPPRRRRATFQTLKDCAAFRAGESIQAGVDPKPEVTRARRAVKVVWRMPAGTRVVFGLGPWLRVEERLAGSPWQILEYQGRAFDDQWQSIGIQRIDKADLAESIGDFFGLGDADELWTASFRLPRELDPAKELRVVLQPRDAWGGFHKKIPPAAR
ncbi:MAG TPA: neutral/alkaline non-lysosomal ceramidase N-terminal domain-containing protein [Planctomycetota bacterium]